MNTELIISAAIELCSFCKSNEYPKFPSPEFCKLTEFIDKLDTALRTQGLMGPYNNLSKVKPWIDPNIANSFEWNATPIVPPGK